MGISERLRNLKSRIEKKVSDRQSTQLNKLKQKRMKLESKADVVKKFNEEETRIKKARDIINKKRFIKLQKVKENVNNIKGNSNSALNHFSAGSPSTSPFLSQEKTKKQKKGVW